MGLLLLIALAVLQGLTEFLPVSSSGHLVLAQAVAPGDRLAEDVTVEVALHLGTLAAVLLYFRHDLLGLARGMLRPGSGSASFGGRERSIIAYLAVGTVPAAAAGLLAKDSIERAFARPDLVGLLLLLTGAGLAATRWLPGRDLSEARMGPGRALLVGGAQALALLPGVSRSGATIVAGLALGLEREAAFRFSFLLSVPAILGAAALQGWEIASGAATPVESPLALALAAAVAAGVGLASLAILRRAVTGRRLHWFALYCAVVGALALALSRGSAA